MSSSFSAGRCRPASEADGDEKPEEVMWRLQSIADRKLSAIAAPDLYEGCSINKLQNGVILLV